MTLDEERETVYCWLADEVLPNTQARVLNRHVLDSIAEDIVMAAFDLHEVSAAFDERGWVKRCEECGEFYSEETALDHAGCQLDIDRRDAYGSLE